MFLCVCVCWKKITSETVFWDCYFLIIPATHNYHPLYVYAYTHNFVRMLLQMMEILKLNVEYITSVLLTEYHLFLKDI